MVAGLKVGMLEGLSAVEVGLARSARLRQAVLRSAFEGKLTSHMKPDTGTLDT